MSTTPETALEHLRRSLEAHVLRAHDAAGAAATKARMALLQPEHVEEYLVAAAEADRLSAELRTFDAGMHRRELEAALRGAAGLPGDEAERIREALRVHDASLHRQLLHDLLRQANHTLNLENARARAKGFSNPEACEEVRKAGEEVDRIRARIADLDTTAAPTAA